VKKMTREEVLRLVREFRQRLVPLYGDRLKGVYLYGSYARGDAREDSDIDVAVVLEGPVRARQESRRTSDLVGDLSLRENCVLMPFFISDQEYRATPEAVHRSIVREGCLV
jgi:type I restriction enzyme S subunit